MEEFQQPTSPVQQNIPFTERKGVVIVTLFLFFPLGLFWLWKSRQFGHLGKYGLTAVIVVLVIGAMSGPKPPQSHSQNIQTTEQRDQVPQPVPGQAAKAEASVPTKLPAGVTMTNFKRLQNGMTYEKVVEILGEDGEEMSRVADPGLGIGETVMYGWKAGFFGANMNATFQGRKLVMKAQFGLK